MTVNLIDSDLLIEELMKIKVDAGGGLRGERLARKVENFVKEDIVDIVKAMPKFPIKIK